MFCITQLIHSQPLHRCGFPHRNISYLWFHIFLLFFATADSHSNGTPGRLPQSYGMLVGLDALLKIVWSKRAQLKITQIKIAQLKIAQLKTVLLKSAHLKVSKGKIKAVSGAG